MITLSDKEQLLLQAAITNLTVPDLAAVIDFEKVAEVTGHAGKSVARVMFKRMMVKIESGDQLAQTPTTSKSKKRKAEDMADKGDKINAKGTKKSRAKAYTEEELVEGFKGVGEAFEEIGEEFKELTEGFKDLKAKTKRQSQPDVLKSV